MLTEPSVCLSALLLYIRAAFVNPLRPEGPEEEKLFQEGEGMTPSHNHQDKTVPSFYMPTTVINKDGHRVSTFAKPPGKSVRL